VIGYEGEPSCAGNNRYVASLATKREWIVPLEFCSLEAPAFPRQPFAGVAVYITTRREAEAFDGWPTELVDRMSAAELVVSVNAVPETIRRTAKVLRRLEGCHVLLSHLGQPPARKAEPSRGEVLTILEPVLALATAPRIGVKLSGLYSISAPSHAYPHAVVRPFIECLVARFGSKRLYWGSDFSPALDHVSFAQTIDAVSDLPWSRTERLAVMGGNLSRLFSSVRGRSERAP
jgi:L-fuconolactonase